MRSDVALQQPRSRETLPAILTLAALIVRSHVHRKRRHAYVKFIAMRTSSRFFIGRTTMCLSVSCQIARCTVSFATIRTLVFVVFCGSCSVCCFNNTWCLLDDGLCVGLIAIDGVSLKYNRI